MLFSNTKVDAFFLEYDNERAGDFEPLRFIKDQFVVLGLVTTKHGGLESKEQLKARIEEAAQYVDIEKLCLSPQCGFASTEEGNILTEEEQWDKVRLVIETAREVWL
ncbi:5-methyltetrahydropteroyltriglutamate--homocysteine methyltransferase [compost metagenome]